MQALDFDAQFRAQFRIEVGERFVEQEDIDIADKRAADRDALALAAGERCGLALQ
ncbi:hypothetical protein D3C73_434640 [compost metagenome]